MTTSLIQTFLSGLRQLRTGHRNSSASVYWRAAAAIGAGTTPKDKEAAIAEALDKLGRDEDDLAGDAQLLAELARVQEQESRQAAIRARHKDALRARVQADTRAAELEKKAQQLRAEASAAVEEATNEGAVAQRANERANQLRAALAKRGHPEFVAKAEAGDRARRIDSIAAELRVAESDRAAISQVDLDAAAETLKRAETHRVMPMDVAAAQRLIGEAELRDARCNSLRARIEALRNGDDDYVAPDAVTADAADLEESEVPQ